MMTSIARAALSPGFHIAGVTASRGVPMILDDVQLTAAAPGVVEMGVENTNSLAGIIIGAFGDPGINALRGMLDIPVVGICEASMLQASAGGRRFGIATVTPGLVGSFAKKARILGVGHLFTGTRLTEGDPEVLAADPERLEVALSGAVETCFRADGAEAVIIGGGPLGQAATDLSRRYSAPVIAPIPSAVAMLIKCLRSTRRKDVMRGNTL
jgi:allantoin racemase